MSLASYHCSTPGRVSLGRLGLAAAVAAEDAGRRKLAELVTDHVFRHEQLHELLAVVDLKGVADEIRHDHAVPRPSLERPSSGTHPFDLGQQALIDVRPSFWQFLGATHMRATTCLRIVYCL